MMNKYERITIAGFGGQGVMMIGQMLAYAGNEAGLNSLWYPSYGPETRGGTANCAVIISSEYINSPVFSKANALIAMNKPSLDRFYQKVQHDGIIIYNSSLITEEIKIDNVKVYGIPANDIALQIGNNKVANTVMLGAYLELTNLFTEELIEKVLKIFLGEGKAALVGVNIEAINAGRKFIQDKFTKESS